MFFLRLFPHIQLATYKLTDHDAKLQTFSETAKRFCHFLGAVVLELYGIVWYPPQPLHRYTVTSLHGGVSTS